MFKRFLRDDSGATLVEYGMILTFISIAVINGVGYYGNELEVIWTKLSNGVKTHKFQ